MPGGKDHGCSWCFSQADKQGVISSGEDWSQLPHTHTFGLKKPRSHHLAFANSIWLSFHRAMMTSVSLKETMKVSEHNHFLWPSPCSGMEKQCEAYEKCISCSRFWRDSCAVIMNFVAMRVASQILKVTSSSSIVSGRMCQESAAPKASGHDECANFLGEFRHQRPTAIHSISLSLRPAQTWKHFCETVHAFAGFRCAVVVAESEPPEDRGDHEMSAIHWNQCDGKVVCQNSWGCNRSLSWRYIYI